MTTAEHRDGAPPWPSSVLVTGGAGFIGCNLVRHLVAAGVSVTALDNLSAPSAAVNASDLQAEHGDDFRFVHGDIRSPADVAAAVHGVDAIVHLAGQTAVTRSIIDPGADFEANCVGTFNVLEAARLSPKQPIVVYASTNKVYGDLDDVAIVEDCDHYRFADRPDGIDEQQPIDLASPYACSKGAGEQYVRDYHRTFGLPTIVFRQSCIYGPRQLGTEDQGWVSWFAVAAMLDRRITIYGDGKQVRDLLYVADLIEAFGLAISGIGRTSGQVYNIGGGAEYRLSIWWQLGPVLEAALGREIPTPEFGGWRLGDQKAFYADCSKAGRDFGWVPTTPPGAGIAQLVDWLRDRVP